MTKYSFEIPPPPPKLEDRPAQKIDQPPALTFELVLDSFRTCPHKKLLLPVQTKFKAQGVGVNIVYPFSHPPASLSSSILQLVFLMSCFIPLDAWEEFSFLLLYCNIELYAVWRPSYQNNLSQNLILR